MGNDINKNALLGAFFLFPIDFFVELCYTVCKEKKICLIVSLSAVAWRGYPQRLR